MRLIDADELKKCAIPCEIHNGALTDLCVPLYQMSNEDITKYIIDYCQHCNGEGCPLLMECMKGRKKKMRFDNAPTVKPDEIQAIMKDYLVFRCEPQGKCKTCKHYQPYYEQFSNKPRGDGFCRIVRMAYEGATTINCHDEFGCSDYEKETDNGS